MFAVSISHTLSLDILDASDIMHTTSGRDSIRCLTRTPCGCLWHSPIMHYRLEGCRPHFLVLHRCRLPVNLRWDLGRVNKRWSRPSMEWRLSTDGDDHLGSGHDVDGCCLCIVRYRGNSSCWLGLWIATVSLKKTYALLNKREVKMTGYQPIMDRDKVEVNKNAK